MIIASTVNTYHREVAMARTAPISLRVEPHVKAALEHRAETARRTLASYVEILLVNHVAERPASDTPAQ